MGIKHQLKILAAKLRNKSCRIDWSSHLVDTRLEGHNEINPGAKIYSSSLGCFTYVNYNSIIANSRIGRFCSIGPGCVIGLGDHPSKKFVSTSPFLYKEGFFRAYATFVENSEVIIGNDVWIGANVTITNGAIIGDGAIIGANSIVKGQIEPYSIVGGVPAKLIRYRFSESDIQQLLDLKWWDKSLEWIRKHIGLFNDVSSLIKFHTDSQ